MVNPTGPPEEPIVLEEALQRFNREGQKGTCQTPRFRLPYFVWGQGPPLLFIHGVSDNFCSFIQPIALLSRRFRCIAYNQAGMPGDGSRISRYRHDDLVDDALALLDHLNVKQTHIFGSSFGSTVTLQALRAAPHRFDKAVLQGGLCYRPLGRQEWIMAQMARWFPGRMKNIPSRVKIADLVNGAFFKRRPPSTWEFFLETTGKAPIRTFAHQVLMLNRLDLRPVLSDVRHPVLLLCGAKDTVTGPRHARMLLEGLPNATMATIPECGHVPSYTHPEILVEAVTRFLNPTASVSSAIARTPEVDQDQFP